MLDSLEVIREELARLEARVKSLEKKTKSPVAASLTGNSPPPATDPLACSMYVHATAAGFTGTKFVRCPDDYYSWTLQERRKYLNAPHITHLTKSIVMENTRHNGSEDPTDALRSKYICVVTPYTAKIDSSRLRTLIRGMYKERGMAVPSAKFFNYRLVTDCVGVTGYEPNGVTPLGLLTDMPVVLAKEIVALNPAEFWLGGGEVSLKWKVRVDEFCEAFKPVIIDFTEKALHHRVGFGIGTLQTQNCPFPGRRFMREVVLVELAFAGCGIDVMLQQILEFLMNAAQVYRPKVRCGKPKQSRNYCLPRFDPFDPS